MKYPLEDFSLNREIGVHLPPGGGGNFSYSDGDSEELRVIEKLASVSDRSIHSRELQSLKDDWVLEYHCTPMRHNLLRHIELGPQDSVLELGCGCGAISRQLGETGASVCAIEGSARRAHAAALRCKDLPNVSFYASNFEAIKWTRKFSVVTLIGVLEYSRQFFDSPDPIEACLRVALDALAPNGVLIVAIENQLGLKYWCGNTEDHVSKKYFGIEDRYTSKSVVTFGRNELEDVIRRVGFVDVRFQYPYPDYKLPRAVLDESAFMHPLFSPEEIVRQFDSRDYSDPNLKPSIEEQLVVPVLKRNGILHHMANSFLVLASPSKAMVNTRLTRGSLGTINTTDRAPAYNIKTEFLAGSDGRIEVEKHYLAPSFDRTPRRTDILMHQLDRAPYVQGKNLHAEMVRALRIDDLAEFSRLLSAFVGWVEQSGVVDVNRSRKVDSILQSDYIDCLPSNVVINGDRLSLIDKEWRCMVPLTMGVLLVRIVDAIVNEKVARERHVTKRDIFTALGSVGYEIDGSVEASCDQLVDAIERQVYRGI